MRPTTPLQGSETISISIGLGSDARTASSIVLPRGHDLVRHLERLLPQLAKTVAASSNSGQYSPTSPQFTDAHSISLHGLHQQHMYAHSPQQQPQHAPAPRGVYAHRHHPYQLAPSRSVYPEPPQSPYLSDASSTDSLGRSSSSGSVYNTHMLDLQQPLAAHHQQQQQEFAAGGRRRRAPAGAQGNAGKKCQFPNCEKISVSRGLCRGHGGGRRCQRPGCGKGAQSRSDFCWAHGGGQRCEVKNCMRSRKSKRFCVAHLSWETAAPSDAASVEAPKAIMPKPLAPYPAAEVYSPTTLNLPALTHASKLPSLQQALRKNQCVSGASSSAAFPHATATTC
ncbi:hypothetical protein PybrP1_007163 [[Pythium] brassicae (nom. inval.)]|nr:hypothetical protein PybrP1_007163 [[Pythium] brassicae (nom. inval.)]